MHWGLAATNMLAIAFAHQDREGASQIVSDALAIALTAGVCLGIALYFIAPSALTQIAGPRSAALAGPAATYVRIRYGQ